ncbi:site-2 protease family protein [Jeongeupia sp. USM3]|uniref:site-2 protease family protein n=1 Tax=Jeongeupia sp. USM3 TaxID=1906741 RepID=UPI00089DFE79|nr:site-2 protease family protein [Jeongeupia sp. USM3]AOX99457.1 site-2 protease family protein [Jeongeupia sp. USM3]
MGGFDLGSFIQTVCIWAIPVLFAITVHEAAHGYVARHFGDDTASRLGRISLNPVRHIDPIGTVVLPMALLALGGFLFGWAKPVPVDFGKLRNPKRDMLWVAAAGPGSNFAMAIVWALLMKVALGLEGFSLQEPMFLMGQAGVTINLSLMVLNLLPLPPLDGGRILVSLLPHRQAELVSRIEPYGFFILIALLATNLLTAIMNPLMKIAALPIMFILH